MNTLNFMLLLFFPLYIAGKNLKANNSTTQRHLPKPRQLSSSASVEKHSEGKLNVDVEAKISKRQHGNVVKETRNDHDTLKRPERLFHSKRKSKVDIHEKSGRSGHEKKMEEKKGSRTTKRLHIIKGKRKSHIDIHGVQGSSPIMYSSPDGQDHYLTIRTNDHRHAQGMPLILQANQQGIHVNSALPSKTFLVTVYGDQIDGAEERIRYALTEEPLRKCHPCKCISTPSPCKPIEEFCPCAKFTKDEPPNQPVSLQVGGQKLILFPNSGKPFDRSGCICPCCLCSCTEPGYENYNCGCQNFPPVPCPCSSATQAPPSSTSSPVTSWTEETSTCPCSCCPCACAQPQTYPDYRCGCASQPPTPCPCHNQGWNYYQGAANVVRSVSTFPTPPAYSPYTLSVPANNGPVARTFRSGSNMVERSCDCYCCPCSCPGTEYLAYENHQCSCGQETQATCTCRRSEVEKIESEKTLK